MNYNQTFNKTDNYLVMKNIGNSYSLLPLISGNKFNVLLERTGDNTTDFLYSLGVVHSIDLLFVLLLGFYLLLTLSHNKLLLFKDRLPISLQSYYLKLISSSNKVNIAILWFCWIILFIGVFLSNYYFDFLIDNLDAILKSP